MFPRFSPCFGKLVYLGSDESFLSHTGNYQLKMIDWVTKEVTTVLDYVPSAHPDIDYAGLFGFHSIFESSRFLSSRYLVISSECMARERVYFVDLESKTIKSLRLPNETE
jgi:hypothetical protein